MCWLTLRKNKTLYRHKPIIPPGSGGGMESDIARKIKEMTNENVHLCYQCGKCSAGCPICEEMDYLPSQIIRLIQLGDEASLLNSKTPWLCAACLVCHARCPMGINLGSVMEGVRRYIMRLGIDFISPCTLPAELIEKAPQQLFVAGLRKYSI